MAGVVSEDLQGAGGPNSSIDYGSAGAVAGEQKQLQTVANQQPASGPQGQPQAQPPQQGGPVAPMAPQPVQPQPPSPGGMLPQNGQLNLDAVFPYNAVQTANPGPLALHVRDQVRMAARHPNASPAVRAIADRLGSGPGVQ